MLFSKKIKGIEKRLSMCDDFELELFKQIVDAKEAIRALIAEVKRRDEIIEKLREQMADMDRCLDGLNAKLHVMCNRQEHAGCVILPVASIATLDTAKAEGRDAK